jgi:hypothetical protein
MNMKQTSKKVALSGSAFLFATLISFDRSGQRAVSMSFEKAQARVGRPLTPLSGAGVARRQYRRGGYGYGGAAAVGTAAAVGATAPYYAGGGYYSGDTLQEAEYDDYPAATFTSELTIPAQIIIQVVPMTVALFGKPERRTMVVTHPLDP